MQLPNGDNCVVGQRDDSRRPNGHHWPARRPLRVTRDLNRLTSRFKRAGRAQIESDRGRFAAAASKIDCAVARDWPSRLTQKGRPLGPARSYAAHNTIPLWPVAINPILLLATTAHACWRQPGLEPIRTDDNAALSAQPAAHSPLSLAAVTLARYSRRHACTTPGIVLRRRTVAGLTLLGCVRACRSAVRARAVAAAAHHRAAAPSLGLKCARRQAALGAPTYPMRSAVRASFCFPDRARLFQRLDVPTSDYSMQSIILY
jgi:hypothetical protein